MSDHEGHDDENVTSEGEKGICTPAEEAEKPKVLKKRAYTKRAKKQTMDCSQKRFKVSAQKDIQVNLKEALPDVGDFKYGDTAQKVLCAKMTSQSLIMVTVSWERRSDGTLPKPSSFTN